MTLPLHSSPPTVSRTPYMGWQQNFATQLPKCSLILVSGSRIGLVHSPYQAKPNVYTQLPLMQLPWPELSFETVFAHIPTGYPETLKQNVLAEVSRVAWKRIWVLAPTVPANLEGCFVTHDSFRLRLPQQFRPSDVDKTLVWSCFETNL